MFWLLLACFNLLGVAVNVQRGGGALAAACMVGAIGALALFFGDGDG